MKKTFIPSLHPGEDVFEIYAFNRLSGKEMADFEEHLLICEKCQETLAQTDVYIRLMKAATAYAFEQNLVRDDGPRRSRECGLSVLQK